ncbi:MAG: hypothetical protein QG656_248 [Candidatus Hydrogenedentes bacterium]|nr:hypothetical protein [Candidatus Hydrogenedentota bacterium]
MRIPLKIHKHPPEAVLTVAHRGGVLAPGAHENSRLSIEGAIARGYDLIELDVMSTIDHHPILAHGAWRLYESSQRPPIAEITFHDKTLDEAKQQRHPVNGERVLTLAAGLELCRGHAGVMLDFKMEGAAPVFFQRVREAIETYEFSNKILTISKEVPGVRECLEGKALFAIGPGEVQPLADRWALGPQYYGFGIPDAQPGANTPDNGGLTEEDVARFHNFGLPVIVAINTFRYYQYYPDAAQTHIERAARDIERFRKAQADGFQLDSIYDHLLFGSSMVSE